MYWKLLHPLMTIVHQYKDHSTWAYEHILLIYPCLSLAQSTFGSCSNCASLYISGILLTWHLWYMSMYPVMRWDSYMLAWMSSINTNPSLYIFIATYWYVPATPNVQPCTTPYDLVTVTWPITCSPHTSHTWTMIQMCKPMHNHHHQSIIHSII